MNKCRHTGWLNIRDKGGEFDLEITDRPQQLIDEFKQPDTTHAGLLVLVGNQSKKAALRRLVFAKGDIRARANAEVHLLSGSLQESRQQPLIIADTDVSRTKIRTSPYKPCICHQISTQTFSPEFKQSDSPKAFDNVFRKVVLPHADVICMFLRDIGGLPACLDRLKTWAKEGAASTSPVKPRLLLITCQERLKQDRDRLQTFLGDQNKVIVERSFRSVTILGVPKASGKGQRKRCKLNRRWRVFGSEIARALELSRFSRRRYNQLFSVTHIAAFLDQSTSRVGASPCKPYDFLQVSRLQNPIASDLAYHLCNFMNCFRSWKELRDVGVALIASSLLLDQFPPGMHLFDPHHVFETLYKHACREASGKLKLRFNDSESSVEIVESIRRSLLTQFVKFRACGSSRDWHKQQLARYKDMFTDVMSSETCLSCIRRRPQDTFDCGHQICRVCVKILFPRSDDDRFLVKVETCPICLTALGDASIRLIPDTCRMRVLSVDGGGIRGAAPLGFLKALQEEVDIENFGIQRHFDVKFGTSSGGLSVISLGILGWTVDDCMSQLKGFATEAFTSQGKILKLASSVPILSFATGLFSFLVTLLFDSRYSATRLERHLIATYGRNRGITNLSLTSQTGAHVGVTLTRARDGTSFVATNYNGAGHRSEKSDYFHLPCTSTGSSIKWWEVLRAATAAPYYYRPKRLGIHGSYQDGGLAFNNPASIALREAIALTPDETEPSLLLSLGTGSSNHLRSSLSTIFEAFPFRVYRALWQRVSSKTAWNGLLGHQKASSKCRLFRFDLDFEQEGPSLDDVEKMDNVQRQAQNIGIQSPALKILASQLRAELFYFELDERRPFSYSNGMYHCVGRILCRLKAPTVEYGSLVGKLRDSGSVFSVQGQSVRFDQLNTNDDLIVKVIISVSSCDQLFAIKLFQGIHSQCDISGSPFTIEWLVRRQSLNAKFGVLDHRKRKAQNECYKFSVKRSRI